MRDKKVFSILIIVFVLLVFTQSHPWSDSFGQVESFRGAQLESSVFNPLISENLNKTSTLKLKVDDESYSDENGELMLDSDMNVLASLNLVRKVFSASARLYSGNNVIVERNSDTYSFNLGEKEGRKNGNDEVKLKVAPEQYGTNVYLPLKDVSGLFGYGYSWDGRSKTVKIDSSTAEAPRLSSKFDLRDKERAPAVKNQGSLSTCWAYAATAALESSQLPEDGTEFDARDMAKRNTYKRSMKEPGNYMMAVSYLLSWIGPIEENGTGTARHLQEVHFYDQDDIDDIKWAVFLNGGVSTSLYAETGGNFEKSDYYNALTDSYYYYGNEEPNHDVVIIGWNDDYPASRFGHKCPGNGAYICQNSWGDDFGDKGVFYVSYYDTNIGNFGVSYVKLESNTNYDRIYQSDLCGDIGKAGFDTKICQAANVYKAASDETLKAAGFYNTVKDTSYEVYAVSDFTGTDSLTDRELVARGRLHDLGYYTIPFDTDVEVREGSKFAVVIVLKTEKSGKQIAIEYDGNQLTKNVDIKDGEGYISRNGVNWERTESKFDANICLKVYADESKKQ